MNDKPVSKWADLGIRTLSAVVLVPVVLFVVWRGGVLFTGFLAVLGILMAREWVQISFAGSRTQLLVHYLAAIAFVVGAPGQVVICLLFLTLVSLLIQRKMNPGFWTLIGIAYIGLPILGFDLIRGSLDFGFLAVVWCMVIVWSADVMAYFFGRIIGGPKMAPRISPKKTWAGMAGAIFGAVLVSICVSYFSGLGVWPLSGLAALFAVVEQGGDIFESAFKRHYGVKDSGNLIPGHGGILDRIDGLSAVVVGAAIIGFVHNPASPAAGLLLW